MAKRLGIDKTVLILFLVLFSLRIIFLLVTPLRGDEKEFIAIAKTLSFSSSNLNLPFEHPLIKHPSLPAYFIRFGIGVLGDNLLGYRVFLFLFGYLTLILIYFFIKKTLSRNAAIIALVLLGLNQYHLGISGLAYCDNMLVFLSACALYFFWKGFSEVKFWPFALCGVMLSLGFLVKEIILGLLFCFVLYLLIYSLKDMKLFFKRASVLVLFFLLPLLPYFIWMINNKSCLLIFDKNFILDLGFNLSGINFYLIRLIGLIRKVDYRTLISWECPTMGIADGVFLFCGTILGMILFRDRLSRLMAVIFVFFTLLVCLFRNSEFYWPQISIIPAVFLTSATAIYLKERFKYMSILFILVAIVLFVDAAVFVYNSRKLFPPNRFQSVADCDLDLAQWYYSQGQIDKAIGEALELLSICPNEVRVLNLLGIFYALKKDQASARSYFHRALSVKGDYYPAEHNLKIINAGRNYDTAQFISQR